MVGEGFRPPRSRSRLLAGDEEPRLQGRRLPEAGRVKVAVVVVEHLAQLPNHVEEDHIFVYRGSVLSDVLTKAFGYHFIVLSAKLRHDTASAVGYMNLTVRTRRAKPLSTYCLTLSMIRTAGSGAITTLSTISFLQNIL